MHPDEAPSSSLRHSFPAVVATLVAVHACMAVTRVLATLWALEQGHGEWTVGVLVSLFAVGPIALSLCWDVHTFIVPVIGHAKGLSASSIGFVLGSFAVAATVVRLGIVRWSEALDELKALRAATLLATAVMAGYAWLPGAAWMACGSALLGAALGLVQPMILTFLHQVTLPDRYGQALGLRVLCNSCATMIMPTSLGLLAGATALTAPLWLMASLLVAAQWPVRTLRRLRDRS